jgi:xylulokinase
MEREKMSYLLGIDISTTGNKALLVSTDPAKAGQVVGVAATENPISTPKPLWSEQDPGDWWMGIQSAIRQVLSETGITGEQVLAVGLTGQMHGLVLLDRDGEVLRPSILWNDQRTGPQCEWITEKVGLSNLLAWTGSPALTGFTAPKVIWVRENEPHIYAQAAQILLPKDYIRFKLTGRYATDMAGASGMTLLDLTSRDWSREMLEALDIPPEWLPPTHEGPEITGAISREAAEATGLKAGTPVVGGGGDQAAGAVGVGAVRAGVVGLVLGTSGVVFAPTAEPLVEKEGRLQAHCHAVPGRWHLMGVMLSAAGSLRWYRDTVAPDANYNDLLAPAAKIPAGSEGLVFLPYLTGERAPYPDPNAKGAFIGLTVRHGIPHMTRSVLEGVAFGLRDSMELIKGAGLGQIEQVRVSGGGARSALWRQILADVLDTELVTVNTTEGAAYGAALLAGVGASVWPDVDAACDATIQVVDRVMPQSGQVARYNAFYPVYRGLYGTLKPTFDELTSLVT